MASVPRSDLSRFPPSSGVRWMRRNGAPLRSDHRTASRGRLRYPSSVPYALRISARVDSTGPQGELAEVVGVEGPVGLAGLLQREEAGDMHLERAGLDQPVELLDRLRVGCAVV